MSVTSFVLFSCLVIHNLYFLRLFPTSLYAPLLESEEEFVNAMKTDMEYFDVDGDHFQWFKFQGAAWLTSNIQLSIAFIDHLGADNVGNIFFQEMLPYEKHKLFWDIVYRNLPPNSGAQPNQPLERGIVMVAFGFGLHHARLGLILKDLQKNCPWEDGSFKVIETFNDFLMKSASAFGTTAGYQDPRAQPMLFD